MFWGARACSSFGTISSLPARRSSHALMYTAFEERSSRRWKKDCTPGGTLR
jgi:hypothetical protein